MEDHHYRVMHVNIIRWLILFRPEYNTTGKGRDGTERDRNVVQPLQPEQQRTAVALSSCSHTRTAALTRITYEGAADTSPSCTLIRDDTHTHMYTHGHTVYWGQRRRKEDDASHLCVDKQAGCTCMQSKHVCGYCTVFWWTQDAGYFSASFTVLWAIPHIKCVMMQASMTSLFSSNSQ